MLIKTTKIHTQTKKKPRQKTKKQDQKKEKRKDKTYKQEGWKNT